MENKIAAIIIGFIILVFLILIGSAFMFSESNVKKNFGTISQTEDMSDHHGGENKRPPSPNLDLFVGKPAEDFSLESIDGQTVKLSDYRGKNVVLFFTEGAMCYPACWDQIAAFANDVRFNNDKTITFSIVVDQKKEWEKIITQLPKLSKAKILFDTSKKISSLYTVLNAESSMHPGSFPGHTYFIINADGIISFVMDDPTMAINNDLLTSKILV